MDSSDQIRFQNSTDSAMIVLLPLMMQGAVFPLSPHVCFIRDPQQFLLPPGHLLQPLPPHRPQLAAQHTFFLEIPP